MLALLALMGAVGAGIVVDGLTRPTDSPEEDSDLPEEEPEDGGSLLDLGDVPGDGVPADAVAGSPSGFVADGMPVSDDIADRPVTALALWAGDDVLEGGAGADQFQLQDFGPDLPVGDIAGYNPAEDQLVLLYDASLHGAPVVSAAPVVGSQDMLLRLDGVAVAVIRNAPDLDLSQIILRAG